MKKISILGILAIISTPAMAENVPDSGVMTNNTTYTESCNNTTLGTYTGPANMTAQYTANTYNCPAGQYLVVGDANTEPKCETCPAGSYCPGTNDITYADNMTDTGLSSCPSGYANSDVGATSDAGCYTACVKGQVSHATSVSGKSYKNGTNTCSATGCENGYTSVGFKSELTDFITQQFYELDTDGDGIPDIIDDDDDNDGIPDTDEDAQRWGLDDWTSNETARESGRITFVGLAQCNTNPDVADATGNELIDETGQAEAKHCYCNITNYINYTTDSYTGVIKRDSSRALSSKWVYAGVPSTNTCNYESCSGLCTFSALAPESKAVFRGKLFDAIKDVNVCKANTIELKWDGVTDAGDAATCSYSGDLKTPATAPTKKGYTFTGWKVNK